MGVGRSIVSPLAAADEDMRAFEANFVRLITGRTLTTCVQQHCASGAALLRLGRSLTAFLVQSHPVFSQRIVIFQRTVTTIGFASTRALSGKNHRQQPTHSNSRPNRSRPIQAIAARTADSAINGNASHRSVIHEINRSVTLGIDRIFDSIAHDSSVADLASLILLTASTDPKARTFDERLSVTKIGISRFRLSHPNSSWAPGLESCRSLKQTTSWTKPPSSW